MILLEDKDEVNAPDGDFPYGSVRDRVGSTPGTLGNTKNHSDFHQFFSRMIALSDVTPNGLLDNLTNGFQLFEALQYHCQNERIYDRYYVTLSQAGTNAPTQDFQFENDLSSSPTFSYQAVGTYRLTFAANTFPTTGKIFKPSQALAAGGSYFITAISNSVLEIKTVDAAGTPQNGLLSETTIMIRVYP